MLASLVGGERHNRDKAPEVIAGVDYIPSGQILSQSLGNGIVQEYDYDPRLRATSIRAIRSFDPGSPILNYGYEFDGRSNVLAIRDERPVSSPPAGNPLRNTQSFQYDDLYRVTRVGYSFEEPDSPSSEDAQVTYRYDRLGNMLEKSSDLTKNEKGIPVADLGEMFYGGASGRSGRIGRTGADPGPHALTSSANAGEIDYDANGNLTRFGDLQLTWDFVDRLWAVEDAATRVECVYDYSDTRVIKSVSRKGPNGEQENGPPELSFYIDSNFEIRGDRAVKFVTNGDALFARAVGTLDASATRIQRIRLREGWNHVAIQVEATDLPGQLESGTEGGVEAVLRWNPDDRSFEPVEGGEPSESGSVYAVLSTADRVVAVTGEYGGPSERTIMEGAGFVAPTGLEGNNLPEDLPAGVETAWAYNPETGMWPARYTGEASVLSDLPEILPPSTPLFARSPTAASLSRPASSEGIQYYIADHLGSSNALCDGFGDIVEETVFYPFGHPRAEVLNSTAESKSLGRYLFEQKELDEETGLQYFEARYLSGPLSRFVSVDPEIDPRGLGENPQLLNPYAYGANNPLTEVDPDGRIISIEGNRKYKQTVKETLKRLESESPDAKKLIQGLNNDKRFKVTITYGGKHANSFLPQDRNRGRVAWDPTSALLFDKETIQNGRVVNAQMVHHSALGLAHELGHADGLRTNPQAQLRQGRETAPGGFHNMEEARTIIQVEGPIASQLGLPTRPHHTGFPMTSKGPFSLLSKTPPPLPPRPTEKSFSVRSFKPTPKRRGGGVYKPVKPVKKGGGGGAKRPPKGRGGKK
jgi:RHS repeat-associated protein